MATNDETASFAIDLEDHMSGAAEAAGAALANLKKEMGASTQKLKEMNAALRQLKSVGAGGSAAAKDLKEKIAAQKAGLASAMKSYHELGGDISELGKRTQPTQSGLQSLLKATKGLPGPLGAFSSRLAGIGGVAGAASLGIGLVVGAMVALLAITARATVSLLRYGIAQSDARRSELLRLEGLTTLRRAYGLTAGSATEMQGAIDRVSEMTTLGRGELERYTSQLHRMRFRGENLSQALEGVALAMQVQGDRGAARFLAQASAINRTGGEVRRLTEDYQARLGPIARRQMLALDMQTRRLHQNLERLFSGLRIESFLTGLQGVLSVFSQTTSSGRALKRIVESLFQPLVDFLGGPVALLARRFFQGMVLGALLVERQILRLRIYLRQTFGDSSPFANIDTEMLVFRVGAGLVLGFAAAVVTAAAALTALGVAAAAIASPIVTIGALIAGSTAMVVTMTHQMSQAAIRWGTGLVDGLVEGIRSRVSRVREAVSGVATAVRERFTGALQIRSPSRVFAQLGEQIPAGIELGIESGTRDATAAAAQLVEAPGALGGARAGTTLTIQEVHIHTQSDDPREHARSFLDQLNELLEGAAITIGAPT